MTAKILRKYKLQLIQIILAVLCVPVFYIASENLNSKNSFLVSFAVYWIHLLAFSILVWKFFKTEGFFNYLSIPKLDKFSLFAFLPTIATFFVVFIQKVSDIDLAGLFIVLAISITNGFFEEFFWRGLTLSISRSFIAISFSTLIFTLFHLNFLLLDIQYHGGAINLVGGAAMMGILWIWIAGRTKSIWVVTLAHIFVNFFAFTGLYVDNFLG